jgi:hypothetical protein
MTPSRCLDVGGLALRWALLLFLVFDQMATPFQGYRHDANMGGSALAQTGPDDAGINIGAACLPKLGLVGMRPSTPAHAHMALFVAAASDDEDQTPWLHARQVLISLWSDWPAAAAAVDHFLSVDPPSPRTRAVSTPPHTRAPPLQA